MARHTRSRPRNRHDRARAEEHAAVLLERLGQKSDEVRELEAAARQARRKLQNQILRHVRARELDISDMAKRTGISRQTIHRLIRARDPHPPRPVPEWVAGQRVVHPSRGVGTVKEADGARLLIRFDSGERSELHARLARITPLGASRSAVSPLQQRQAGGNGMAPSAPRFCAPDGTAQAPCSGIANRDSEGASHVNSQDQQQR